MGVDFAILIINIKYYILHIYFIFLYPQEILWLKEWNFYLYFFRFGFLCFQLALKRFQKKYIHFLHLFFV